MYYDAAHEVAGELAVRAFPTTALIGADGSILANAVGRISYESTDSVLAGL